MNWIDRVGILCLGFSLVITQIKMYDISRAVDVLKQEVKALDNELKDLTKITKE